MFKELCSITLVALLGFPATAQNNPGSAQPGAAPSTLVGCVQKTRDVYTLSDETSKIVTQLRGGALRDGRHVQVTGTPAADATPAAGATQVLDVTSVKPLAGSCRVDSAGSAYVAPDAAKRGKIIGAAIIAVIATGVAVEIISRQGAARGN